MNSFLLNAVGFWGHNDADMLEVGNEDLSVEESRTHFALWAAMKSPLMIGADVSLHSSFSRLLVVKLTIGLYRSLKLKTSFLIFSAINISSNSVRTSKSESLQLHTNGAIMRTGPTMQNIQLNTGPAHRLKEL